jgi:hypothetical protein
LAHKLPDGEIHFSNKTIIFDVSLLLPPTATFPLAKLSANARGARLQSNSSSPKVVAIHLSLSSSTLTGLWVRRP